MCRGEVFIKYLLFTLTLFRRFLKDFANQLYKLKNKPVLFNSVIFFVVLVFWCCMTKGIGPVGPDGQLLTWAKMNFEQRKLHMSNVVLPRAGAVFREWRPDKYSGINCSLCHGNAENTGDFHMPTGHLPRLSGQLLLGPEREKYPDTTDLKLNRLVPEMADALGVSSFSVITRRGFGCYSCHLGPSGPMFGH